MLYDAKTFVNRLMNRSNT